MSVAIAGTIGTLGGCISGSGGGKGNSSGNGSGGGSADNNNGENSSGSGTQVDAFSKRPSFDGQNLYIPVRPEANIDEVQLRDANKQMWGTNEIKGGEGSAKFTLIKESAGEYQAYPFGTYEIYAIRNGSQVDGGNFDLRPQFDVTEVASGDSGKLRVTFENVGSGPGVVTRARLYKEGTNPAENDGWALGSYSGFDPEIVPPGETTTIPVMPFGFGEVYAEGTDDVTPENSSEGVCAGETKAAAVDYKLFGDIESGPQLTLKFSGGRSQLDRPGVGCKRVSIQSSSGGNSSSATTSSPTTEA